jgi:membrane protease YdiL (CAAX protease family)
MSYPTRMSLDAEVDQAPPLLERPAVLEQARPTLGERLGALLEVLICSGYPTQIAIGMAVAALGLRPGGPMDIVYVFAVSLLDAVVLLALILAFLRNHGQSPREVLLGKRRPIAEALAGVPMMFIAFGVAVVVLAAVRVFAPSLHDVPLNPLQGLIHGPVDVLLFAIVVVVAGGVREEIQRAFLLNRFERSLGGGGVGLVVTSAAFGAGHLLQGTDAAIATGLLGAFWARVYLRRRSVVAPIVSHSGFNLMQLLQFMTIGR